MQKVKLDWKYRWSPTLGSLESTPEEIWGIEAYDPSLHQEHPVVFCGLYSLNDFVALRNHRGPKTIWWTGSDIKRFRDGYWLDDLGNLRIPTYQLARYISQECNSWVENQVEADWLRAMGIVAYVCPSFVGKLEEYQVTWKPGNRVYASVSGNDFELYRWKEIMQLARYYPEIEFHLYGNTVPYTPARALANVRVHGRVPKQQMNEEIKEMQGGLRLLPLDGFSEVLAKSVLWGQWPISLIEYPHMLTPDELWKIPKERMANTAGRDYYLEKLNRYPWNANKKGPV